MNIYQQLMSVLPDAPPLNLIDVGAMGGVSEYWRRVGKQMHVIAFEPDEREYQQLKSSSNITYLPFALYQSSTDINFYVSKESGKSSIYKPNMEVIKDFGFVERMQTVQEVLIPANRVKTLDQALKHNNIEGVDFIKLDTQGSELSILKGAQQYLPHIFGIEIEVEFLALYQGQPLFRDCDAFLDAHGFELIDLRRAYWKRKYFSNYIGRGQLAFADALYLQRDDVFLSRLKILDQAQQDVLMAHALIVCMVYTLPDRAIGLIDKALAAGSISEQQAQHWRACIVKSMASVGMPWLPGREFIAKIFNKLAESTPQRSYLGYFDGDRFIGNSRNK